ncbi:MAG: hypothetical protein M3323_07250 [Actinomycetota bacterium]|nr:hypothetical protein [Actinomycetota bacterium]
MLADAGDAGRNDCFFITPIGKRGTPEREAADGVLKAIVAPAARRLGMVPVRADRMVEPGVITTQIVDHLIASRMVVADLTGGNANVYYELAVRHSFRKPAALLAREGERLPFDTSVMRTVFYEPEKLTSVADAVEDLAGHMRRGLRGAVDSPVATAVDLRSLREGTPAEVRYAELIRGLQSLRLDYQRVLDAVEGKAHAGARVPDHLLDALRRLDEELDAHAADMPQLRAAADSLRDTLAELEAYSEPVPAPPPIRPMDEFYDALTALAREKKWVDLDVLADLLRDDPEEPPT